MGQHSVAEASYSLAELIDRAMRGESIVITREGFPVAEIKPIGVAPPALSDKKLDWLESVAIQPLGLGETAEDAVRAIRDEWDR
jgi:prevent-host-death family protein